MPGATVWQVVCQDRARGARGSQDGRKSLLRLRIDTRQMSHSTARQQLETHAIIPGDHGVKGNEVNRPSGRKAGLSRRSGDWTGGGAGGDLDITRGDLKFTGYGAVGHEDPTNARDGTPTLHNRCHRSGNATDEQHRRGAVKNPGGAALFRIGEFISTGVATLRRLAPY